MQLFEYAVFKDEKKNRDNVVIDEARILVEPDHMLAKDAAEANLRIARMIPEEELANSDRIAILVRPF